MKLLTASVYCLLDGRQSGYQTAQETEEACRRELNSYLRENEMEAADYWIEDLTDKEYAEWNEVEQMNEWWKNPVLQGPENDYGEYDYMINELPENSIRWSKWPEKCSCCGKYHKHNRIYEEYFYTLDGYDSYSSTVCWKCELANYIQKPIRKIKKWLKLQREILRETATTKKIVKGKYSWLYCYKLSKRICTKLSKK